MANKANRKDAVSVEPFGNGFTRRREEPYAKGYAEGYAVGFIEGKLEGKREVVFSFLTNGFGLSDNAAHRRLRKRSEDELTALAFATLDFQGKADLYRWLRENYD